MKRIIRKIRVEGNIAYVPLTRGYEAMIDVDDVALVGLYNWTSLVCRNTVYVYRNVCSDGKQKNVRMHRVIMGCPEGFEVDHINRDGLDNRRSNLRIATRSQNQHNRKAQTNNTSGFKGVSLDKRTGRWRAEICLFSTRIHVGCFDTAKDAHAAYAKASAELHGDFGRIE